MKRLMLGVAAVAAMSFLPHTAAGQTAPDLVLVHALQGITADVAVDGTVIIPRFEPGSQADISTFAGQTLTNVTLTNVANGETLLGPVAALDIPASGSHDIVAHRKADGEITITPFENDVSDTTDDESARLTIRHTAVADAVDLVVDGERPVAGITNGQSRSFDLAAGQLVDAMLAPAGGDAIAGIRTLDLEANTNTVVYVIGSVPDDTIDFVIHVVDFPGQDTATTTTTTVASATTTTVASGSASTTTVASTTTTTIAGSTTTTSAVPTAVNTGSPIGGSTNLAVVAAVVGLAIAGGATIARRRV